MDWSTCKSNTILKWKHTKLKGKEGKYIYNIWHKKLILQYSGFSKVSKITDDHPYRKQSKK